MVSIPIDFTWSAQHAVKKNPESRDFEVRSGQSFGISEVQFLTFLIDVRQSKWNFWILRSDAKLNKKNMFVCEECLRNMFAKKIMCLEI